LSCCNASIGNLRKIVRDSLRAEKGISYSLLYLNQQSLHADEMRRSDI